jgi:hypothetical protein
MLNANLADSPAIEAFWRDRWVEPMATHATHLGIPEWLDCECGKEKKRLMAALQPPDGLTYEGVGPHIDPISLLRRIAYLQSGEWIVIPQWHPVDPAPPDTLLEELAYHHPNIRIPPAPLRSGQSDAFIPFIDGVATISSNVAAAAAILGKRVWVLGRSKFQALNTGSQASPRARYDLLAFMLRASAARLRSG